MVLASWSNSSLGVSVSPRELKRGLIHPQNNTTWNSEWLCRVSFVPAVTLARYLWLEIEIKFCVFLTVFTTLQSIGGNEYGKTGHSKLFTFMRHFLSFWSAISLLGPQYYTTSQTLITRSAVHLRVNIVKWIPYLTQLKFTLTPDIETRHFFLITTHWVFI